MREAATKKFATVRRKNAAIGLVHNAFVFGLIVMIDNDCQRYLLGCWELGDPSNSPAIAETPFGGNLSAN